MSRQARLIIVVAAMALVAVVALGVMAERYSRIAADQGSTEEVQARAAERQVQRFVLVRTALRDTLEDSGLEQAGDDARRLAFDAALRRALTSTGMERADYRELAGHYARWKDDPASLAAVWREALDRRGAELERCDLGEFEKLDG